MHDPIQLPDGALTISVVDSHTGGEPTRVVTGGFPALAGATLADRAADLRDRHRRLATAIVDEPRGNEAMVGALLTEPDDGRCTTGVIFFDRTLVLGMCGHGTIGLVETLHRLGRIAPGEHLVETPAGVVAVTLGNDGQVTLDNVVSRRLAVDVTIDVDGVGAVTGDIAYGGNVFFLVTSPSFDLGVGRAELLRITSAILLAVHAAGHRTVDHVELFGPPTVAGADSRNFVLCPSGTYDRSPCGTGTSAKVATLAARGLLAEGATWVQESITGSTFSLTFRWHDRDEQSIVPRLTGAAVVTGRAELIIGPDERDGRT
jgi:4-hydroxyproline epimerase